MFGCAIARGRAGALAIGAAFVLLGFSACNSGDPASATPAAEADRVAPTTTATESQTPVLPPPASTPTAEIAPPVTQAECRGTLGAATGIPDTSVAVPVPASFYVALNFTGLFDDDTPGSVVVLELPAPLEEVITDDIEGFLGLLEAQQGVVSIAYDEITVDQRDGYIVRGWQSGGGTRFEKWIVVLGDNDAGATLMLTAQVPTAFADDQLELLRDVLVCAVWTPGFVHEHVDGPLFTFDPGPSFGAEQLVAGSRSYSAGESANFIVSPSLATVPADAQEEAALNLFASLGPGPIDAEPEVTSGPDPISIDGLPGLVIEGSGFNEGEPIWLYQVILFLPNGSWFQMIGSSPESRADELIPQIKAMAESFRYVQ